MQIGCTIVIISIGIKKSHLFLVMFLVKSLVLTLVMSLDCSDELGFGLEHTSSLMSILLEYGSECFIGDFVSTVRFGSGFALGTTRFSSLGPFATFIIAALIL